MKASNSLYNPNLEQLATQYCKQPDAVELNDTMKAILRIAYWLLLPEEQKTTCGLAIKKGQLCIKKGKLSEQKVMDFALKMFFESDLAPLKKEARMPMEWFFANLSRKCKKLNPFSRWLQIATDTFVPYDIATKCSYLKEAKLYPIKQIDDRYTVVAIHQNAIDNLMELDETPIHFCVLRHGGIEVTGKEIKEIANPVPLLNLERVSPYLSPRVERLQLESTSSQSSSGRRRRGALSPTPIDYNELLTPFDTDDSI